MRESLVQLGGEKEIRIYRLCLTGPELADLRLDVPVKRCVNLDHVEVLRQIFHRMLFSFQLLGIDNSLPVLVGKSGDADMEGLCHGDIRSLCHWSCAPENAVPSWVNRKITEWLNKRSSTPSRHR